jgi:hypothetical protein
VKTRPRNNNNNRNNNDNRKNIRNTGIPIGITIVTGLTITTGSHCCTTMTPGHASCLTPTKNVTRRQKE